MVQFLKKNIIGISLLFVILPIIIFLFGFLKIYFAIPFTMVILFCYYKILKTEVLTENSVSFSKKEIILSIIIILIWLFFSGIGNFSFQNDDWNVRNAMLRDLVNHDWPLIFSVEQTNETIFELRDVEKINVAYYFAFWLPAALIGKLLGLTAANIALYIWTFFILFATLYLMKIFLNKKTLLILFFFIFFSGMDALGILISDIKIFSIEHIERWCNQLIQYSSNTTQLYWVFNQSVMCWLITILILNVKNKSSILFISAMIFCYSPFATFGMIPVAIYLVINKFLKEEEKKKSFIKFVFSFETLNSILVLIVFGSFYLSATGSETIRGFIFEIHSATITMGIFLIMYIIFCILEFLIYLFLIIRDSEDVDGLFWVIAIELMLLPLYKMTWANDFCMRGSIVPLFILMLYFIKYVSRYKQKNILEKLIICFIIAVSIITPIHEIARSVYNTKVLSKEEYLKEKEIYSIINPITEDGLKLCNKQFYDRNPENSFFGKYLLKNIN